MIVLMPRTAGTVRSGRFVVVVYGPTLLFAVGQGAVLPVIALSARDLGASVGVAGLVVALTGVGQILGDVPAGALAARLGERRAMIAAVFATAVALAGCVLARSVVVLGASILVTGLAGAVFGLARQTYLTETLPVHARGRGMSTLGGSHRIGLAIGPFVGAAAVGPLGTDGAFLVHLVAAAATVTHTLLAITLAAALVGLGNGLQLRPGAHPQRRRRPAARPLAVLRRLAADHRPRRGRGPARGRCHRHSRLPGGRLRRSSSTRRRRRRHRMALGPPPSGNTDHLTPARRPGRELPLNSAVPAATLRGRVRRTWHSAIPGWLLVGRRIRRVAVWHRRSRLRASIAGSGRCGWSRRGRRRLPPAAPGMSVSTVSGSSRPMLCAPGTRCGCVRPGLSEPSSSPAS